MPYSSDKNIEALRPDILQLGVETWAPQHAEAEVMINRVIEFKWYRAAAADIGIDWRTTAFDPTLLNNAEVQLTRLSSYKALELAYEYLMQASAEPSAFETMRELYAKKYKEELADVLGAGLDYDWSETGVADNAEEVAVPTIRRLKRM